MIILVRLSTGKSLHHSPPTTQNMISELKQIEGKWEAAV